MRSKILFLLSLYGGALLMSCNKDETNPPVDNDPELLNPQASKIFHYSFNGNLNDNSGNNLHAADSGNISYAADRFGRANQAALFGGAGNTSYVVTPSLKSQQISFPFSVSFWFKANSNTGNQTLIKSDGANSSLANYTGFWIQLGVTGPGSMAFNYGNNTSASYSGRKTLITPDIIAANTWYHIVLNFKGADDMELFVNGARNMESNYDGAATDIVFNDPATPGLMGVYGGSVPSDFAGLIDDYRIYKKALTQAEISALYNFQP